MWYNKVFLRIHRVINAVGYIKVRIWDVNNKELLLFKIQFFSWFSHNITSILFKKIKVNGTNLNKYSTSNSYKVDLLVKFVKVDLNYKI